MRERGCVYLLVCFSYDVVVSYGQTVIVFWFFSLFGKMLLVVIVLYDFELGCFGQRVIVIEVVTGCGRGRFEYQFSFSLILFILRIYNISM